MDAKQTKEKRVTVGISLLPSFLNKVDARVIEAGDDDRSAYFKRLAKADIAQGEQISTLIARFNAVVELAGIYRVNKALDAIQAEALAEKAAKVA